MNPDKVKQLQWINLGFNDSRKHGLIYYYNQGDSAGSKEVFAKAVSNGFSYELLPDNIRKNKSLYTVLITATEKLEIARLIRQRSLNGSLRTTIAP